MKIVTVDYPKEVNSDDLFKFRMNEQVQLEILSNDDSTTNTIFKKDGIVTGTPAMVTIVNPNDKRIAKIEGVLIRETGGAYVIPKSLVTKVSDVLENTTKSATELVEEAGQVAKEVVKEADKFDTEKTLGFSKKQLLVMAITTLIVIKIFRN